MSPGDVLVRLDRLEKIVLRLALRLQVKEAEPIWNEIDELRLVYRDWWEEHKSEKEGAP